MFETFAAVNPVTRIVGESLVGQAIFHGATAIGNAVGRSWDHGSLVGNIAAPLATIAIAEVVTLAANDPAKTCQLRAEKHNAELVRRLTNLDEKVRNTLLDGNPPLAALWAAAAQKSKPAIAG